MSCRGTIQTTRSARPRVRTIRSAVATLVVALPLIATPAAPAAGKPSKALPDLVVKKGSLALARGKLVASFQVKNTGSARARSTSTLVATVVSGKVLSLAKASTASLSAGSATTAKVKLSVAGALRTGKHEVTVCADRAHAVKEKSETNNCLDLGTYADGKVTPPASQSAIAKPADVPVASAPGSTPATPAVPGSKPPVAATPTPTPAPTPVPAPGLIHRTPQPRPASTVPTAPLPGFTTADSSKLDDRQTIDSPAGRYWVYVPADYDTSGNTPARLLVWMHGCGGDSEGGVYNASLGGAQQHYITLAPDGAENTCWNVGSDPAKVWAMVFDAETHWNIDRRRIVLGGASSGGDMAYRMAFDDAYDVAGVLAENTAPYQDNGLTSAAISQAFWMFNVVHLAHTGDDTYKLPEVLKETGEMQQAGYSVTVIQRPGGHDDATTDPDLTTYLLPRMNDNSWLAPAAP